MWGMNRLGPSLVAGATAAAGLFLIQLGGATSAAGLGWTPLYWIACTIGFSAAGAGNRQDGFRRLGLAGLGVVGVACGWLVLFPGWDRFSGLGMSFLGLGLMVVFGGVRSGLFDTAANLNLRRALIVEGVLGFGALLFAAWLAGPAPWGPALSLWGYALVQSLYACIPRSFLAKAILGAKVIDPFETALSKLSSILGEEMS